jgi:putative transposase
MRHDDDDRRGSHVVAALNLQLILMTQVSAWGLTGEHLGTLREVFASMCADVGAKLVGMDEDDHVHLLVASPPRVAVARLVHSSRTSRLGGCANTAECATHREHLWSPSYFSASAGGAPLETLRAYIRQQGIPGRPG